MKMKKMSFLFMSIILLVNHTLILAQNDFKAISSTTDKFSGLCYPIQAGKSVKVPISVTCNMNKKFQPYTVAVDIPASFNMYNGWVTIDNNSQNLD